MSGINRTGTVLIREDTPLPAMLSIESEAFLPGWRAVKNLDRQALTRKIEGANWLFFYLAGGTTATVLGRKGLGTLRRAVKCVLAKQEGRKFNSLEITKAVSKRFLGIPFMRVVAHSRHLQESISLVPATDFVSRMPAAPNQEVATKEYAALILILKNSWGT